MSSAMDHAPAASTQDGGLACGACEPDGTMATHGCAFACSVVAVRGDAPPPMLFVGASVGFELRDQRLAGLSRVPDLRPPRADRG